jgi:Alpha-2,8-polysialyltransferase (POLYST)
MLAAAKRLGMTRVLFKPHPSSPPAQTRPLQSWAADHGIDFNVVTSRALVETLLDRIRPALVVSAFSTAVVTARRLHGVPCVSVGTADLLRRLRPFENSNRIPLAIVRATTPDGESVTPDELASWEPPDLDELTEMVRALGYAMQPARRRDLQASAEAFVGRGSQELEALGASRARLTRLGLPGGYPGGAIARRYGDTPAGRLAIKAAGKVRRQGVAKALKSLRP